MASPLQAVETLLLDKIESMISQAKRGSGDKKGKNSPLLPLIRLRIDYTGFSTIHSQRFGQKLVGRVANPQDALHWSKAKPRTKKVT